MIIHEERPGIERSSRQGKQLLHPTSLFPVHQPFGGWRQVEGRHDVPSVTELPLHLLPGDRLHFVYDQLPLPLCPVRAFHGGCLDGSESKALFLVVQQGGRFHVGVHRLRGPVLRCR